ncbi:lipopolysaccharide biosynthesis protein [Streptomyces sp. B1866]|uniref:lipopolysaccharide biosynthesis protein n=1 Tax=Streptomyces sp. B1866 TaxID=3075431 RepID=UPI0028910584|nr:lipopolysaccharide biosynthesis protein [Streptomyces sp. B1866]MDT3395199.1 lipopolysaccharide biosynthesis protein [Streptomyces sp. B1866]
MSHAAPRPALTARLAGLRGDPLLLNSFFLMLTTASGAAAGFVFWIIVAHLFPAAAVGRASSLLSCVALLSYFSLFGLSSTLVRQLPTSRRRAEEVSTALMTVTVCTVVISGGFVALVPWLAPQLGFVHATPLHVVGFVVLAAGAALNLLTDSVFVAFRATKTNLLINGGLMSAAKLALPAALVGAGPFGIFLASGVASVVAAAASVAAIRRRLRVRVRPRFSWQVLRDSLAYTLTSYVSSCLNLLPQIVLPIVVLQRRGPEHAATYFVAFQIANLINSASYAIGEALFAEGSHERSSLAGLARRSGAAMLAVMVPVAGLVVLLARPILGLFGGDYAADGTRTLVVFAVSSLAVAFNTWVSFLLKVTRQLLPAIASNVVLVAVILGLALVRLDSGLHWAAIAWGLGNLASGLVAAFALLRSRPDGAPAPAPSVPDRSIPGPAVAAMAPPVPATAPPVPATAPAGPAPDVGAAATRAPGARAWRAPSWAVPDPDDAPLGPSTSPSTPNPSPEAPPP